MHYQNAVSLKTPFKNVHIRNLTNLSSKKVNYTQYYLWSDKEFLENSWIYFEKNTFLLIHFIFENPAAKNCKMIMIKKERFNGI